MCLIGLFMTTAFMNSAALRDFNNKFDGILFSTPISKAGYLGGRFLGAYLMALIPFLGVFAGIAFGAMSPWVAADEVSAFSLAPYLQSFFIIVMPNILLISSIVFLLATLFRSSTISFLGAIAILVLYIMMIAMVGNLDNEKIAIILDPLAINSLNLITKYWTIDEKNTELLAFAGPILINRLLWFALAAGALVLTFVKFSFHHLRCNIILK